MTDRIVKQQLFILRCRPAMADSEVWVVAPFHDVLALDGQTGEKLVVVPDDDQVWTELEGIFASEAPRMDDVLYGRAFRRAFIATVDGAEDQEYEFEDRPPCPRRERVDFWGPADPPTFREVSLPLVTPSLGSPVQ